jgi:hypothetical protein
MKGRSPNDMRIVALVDENVNVVKIEMLHGNTAIDPK